MTIPAGLPDNGPILLVEDLATKTSVQLYFSPEGYTNALTHYLTDGGRRLHPEEERIEMLRIVLRGTQHFDHPVPPNIKAAWMAYAAKLFEIAFEQEERRTGKPVDRDDIHVMEIAPSPTGMATGFSFHVHDMDRRLAKKMKSGWKLRAMVGDTGGDVIPFPSRKEG